MVPIRPSSSGSKKAIWMKLDGSLCDTSSCNNSSASISYSNQILNFNHRQITIPNPNLKHNLKSSNPITIVTLTLDLWQNKAWNNRCRSKIMSCIKRYIICWIHLYWLSCWKSTSKVYFECYMYLKSASVCELNCLINYNTTFILPN